MAEKNSPLAGGGGRRAQVEKIENLKLRLSAAKQVREQWQAEYKLEELYEKYIGKEKGEGFGDSNDINFRINKFWPTIKVLLPSLFLQNPTFTIRAKNEATNPETVLRAKMAEAALKGIAEQEHHLEFSVKLALLQAFFSIGVLKCVYEPRMIKNPRAGEPMFEHSNGVPILDPETQQLIPLVGQDGQPMVEPRRILDDESYRWNWVNGDKMLLPNAGPDHLRWPWIAEEITVLLEEAREDERFPSNLRNQLRSNTPGPNSMVSRMGMVHDAQHGDKWITYTEVWDRRKKRQMIWVEGQTFSSNHLLLDRDYPPGVEEHPYAILKGFTPIIGPDPSPWPVPHTYNWLGIQREYSVRREQSMIAAKRSARKVYYDQGTFPDADQAVAALQSNQDMEGVMITDVTRPPVAVADPPPPSNIAQDVAFLDSDWNRTTGVSSARSGGGRGRNTATESIIEQQTGETRDLDMRHEVNVWLTVAGKKMLQLLKATLTLGMYVKMRGASDTLYLNYVARVYGPEFAQNVAQFPNVRQSFDEQFGDDRWQVLSREDLEFDADVSVAPGSARPRNMTNEKQDFMEIIRLLSAAPVLTQSRALLRRVGDIFEFFDDSMIDEILAASNQAQRLEQIKAGRTQGNSPEAAAAGGGANVSEFRRNFVG